MTSSDKSSQLTAYIAEIPEILLIDLPEMPCLIADMFPLLDEDRDEILAQIFNHFLDLNELSGVRQFRLNTQMLRMASYEIVNYHASTQQLELLAQNIFAVVYAKLASLRIESAVFAQGGFFYVFQETLPDGHRVVLRNLTPTASQLSLPRHVPDLHP